MKFTIERSLLLKSLSHVQSVVERRNTIPILANVLISAHEGRVSLTATDMDIDIVERVPADTATSGSTTAPAHMLYDIVRKLPDGAQVELEGGGDKERLLVRAGRSSFTLPALPIADFPSIAADTLGHEFLLRADEFRQVIDRTRFAISNEETRYYLNGIYLHAAESKDGAVLRAVATDGHRLARMEVPQPPGADGMPGVIIPRKTVNELYRLIEGCVDDVTCALSPTRIRFSFDDIVLSSKLIDGTFPDYERVIPAGNDKKLLVPRKDFADAVDRVATISTEKSRAVKMAMERHVLTVSASSPDNASATEEIEIDFPQPAMEIGFNSKYLLDIANQIQGEEAQFVMADSGSPTIVQDPADPSALYVLMPMRV